MLAIRRQVIAALCSILLDCCSGCHRDKPEPVTILFMDPGTRCRWEQASCFGSRA
jgi:hypothetical protein